MKLYARELVRSLEFSAEIYTLTCSAKNVSMICISCSSTRVWTVCPIKQIDARLAAEIGQAFVRARKRGTAKITGDTVAPRDHRRYREFANSFQGLS